MDMTNLKDILLAASLAANVGLLITGIRIERQRNIAGANAVGLLQALISVAKGKATASIIDEGKIKIEYGGTDERHP